MPDDFATPDLLQTAATAATQPTSTTATPAAATSTLAIEYFTDPLCCWSWAFEEIWHKFRELYGERITWRYRMSGLIRDWDSYYDPVNSISRPLHMGPLWYHVRQVTGVALDDRIWIEDPPSSSYPVCLACKTAELQSAEAAEWYLRAAREAVMLRRRNVARVEMLRDIADDVAAAHPGQFDAARFATELQQGEALAALREDLHRARDFEITRFPTLLMHAAEGKSLMLLGYRPLQVLCDAYERIHGCGTRPAVW